MPLIAHLFEFWKEKEKEWGRDISVKEVSEATSISRATLSRLRHPNGALNPAPDTVNKLCKYFHVPPGPVPFVVYEPD